MLRSSLLSCLILAAACTNQQVEPSLINPGLNRDVCVVTNMAAVALLEMEIEDTRNGFMTRADLSDEAIGRIEADLAEKRALIVTLMQDRAAMLRNDDWDATEQGASDMALMNSLSAKVDDMIGEAEVDGTSGKTLAKDAMDCARGGAA